MKTEEQIEKKKAELRDMQKRCGKPGGITDNPERTLYFELEGRIHLLDWVLEEK